MKCPFCGNEIDPIYGKVHKPECYLESIAKGQVPLEGAWEHRPIEEDLKKRIFDLLNAGSQLADNDVSGKSNIWYDAVNKDVSDLIQETSTEGAINENREVYQDSSFS